MDDVRFSLGEVEKKIANECRKAGTLKNTDPEQAVMAARRACEAICRQVCIKYNLTAAQGFDERCTLDKLKNLIKKNKLAPPIIVAHIETIQNYGNFVAHNIEMCPSGPALLALSEVVKWFFKTFGTSIPSAGAAEKGRCENYLETIQYYTATVKEFFVEKVADEIKDAADAVASAAESVWKRKVL